MANINLDQFLGNSYVGTQGTQGYQGITGSQGIQGQQGIQGIQGSQGIQGIQGITGRQGIQGIQGITGSQGIQGISGSLSLVPFFTIPNEYGVTGDGTTYDGDNFEVFTFGAENSVMGLVPPGAYRVGGNFTDGATDSRIVAAPGSVIERVVLIDPNTLTFQNAKNVSLDGLTFDGRYDTLNLNGHALALIDVNDMTVDRFTSRNHSGLNTTNGGTGILAYAPDTLLMDKLRVTRSNVTGLGGKFGIRSAGINAQQGRYCIISDSHASSMTNYGIGLNSQTEFSILSSSTGVSNQVSFILGGTLFNNHNNILSALTSKDSDAGVAGTGSFNNLIVGLSVHADTQPNTFDNNQAYGLHLSTGCDENLAIGILASGTIIDYPIRIRGNRNVVSIADYSDGADTITFNAGTLENYVEVLHIGEKNSSITTLIADLNSPIITKGDGANVIDSPLTREYFGSINNHFTWGLDGYSNTYPFADTTGFCYEGNAGQTTLGLGIKDGKQSGIVISNPTTAKLAGFEYVHQVGLSNYWLVNVEGNRVSFNSTSIQPSLANTINLGSTDKPFANAYINQISIKLPVAPAEPTVANGCLGFQAISNTLVRLHFRGNDGTLRFRDLTFA